MSGRLRTDASRKVPGRGDAEDDRLARSGAGELAGFGLGLVDDYLTRPAAELGLLMMGHCTAREAAAFFAKP